MSLIETTKARGITTGDDSEGEIDPNIGTKAIKSVGWMGIASAIGQTFSWSVTLIIARILTPIDYGLMGVATILVGFCLVASDLGLGSATIQSKGIENEQLSGIFWLSMTVATLMYAIIFFCAPFVASFFHEPKAIIVTRVVGLSLIIATLKTIPYSLLAKELSFNKRAKAQVIAVVSSGSIALCMAIFGLGVWALVAASLIREAVLTAACYYLKPWRPTFNWRFDEIREHAVFGTTVAGTNITYYIYSQIDNVIVGRVLGATSLGLFTMGRTLASIPNDKICNLINQVAFPVFSKIQDDEKRIKHYIFKILRMEMAIIWPLLIGGALTAQDLIPVVLTNKWAPLSPIFTILCLLALLGGPGALISSVLLARGHANWLFWRTLVWSFIYPSVLYPVGLRWGLPGILALLLILSILAFIWLLYLCWVDLKISIYDYFRELFSVIISVFLMAITVSALLVIFSNNTSMTMRLVICITAGVVSYLFSIRFLFPSIFNEALNTFKQMRN